MRHNSHRRVEFRICDKANQRTREGQTSVCVCARARVKCSCHTDMRTKSLARSKQTCRGLLCTGPSGFRNNQTELITGWW